MVMAARLLDGGSEPEPDDPVADLMSVPLYDDEVPPGLRGWAG